MLESYSLSRALLGLRAHAASLRRTVPKSKLIWFRSSCPTRADYSRVISKSVFSTSISCSQQARNFSLASRTHSSSSMRPGVTQRIHSGKSVGFTHSRCYAKEVRTDANFGDMTEDQYTKSKHRFRKLSAKRIHDLYGPGMDSKQGNSLLNTVQKQRVTGTLDTDITGPNVTKATVAKTLAWLRKNYPLDEDVAIVARLEREDVNITDWKPQQAADPENAYSGSVLEQWQAKNQEEQKKKEEAEKAEEERIKKEEQKMGPLAVKKKGSFKEVARPRETAEWVKKYREKAALSTDEAPVNAPSMIQALLPTGIFVLSVLALCVGLAIEYEPPPKEARMFPDIPPAAATVGAIVAVNILCMLAWRLPFAWRFMNMNMLIVAYSPQPFSMLGNMFSHQSVWHFVANMGVLWVVGTPLHDEVGRGRFLAIFLGTGVLASWFSLLRFTVFKTYALTSLGASGAICGIAAAYCALRPDKMISLWLLPEGLQKWIAVRADVLLGLFSGYEIFQLWRWSMAADHGSHVGGLIAGVIAAELLKRHARAKKRRLAEQAPDTKTPNLIK